MRLNEWDWYLSEWIADGLIDKVIAAIKENPSLLNARGVLPDTPLIAACSYGYYGLVRDLLAMGADINLISSSGDSALSMTLENSENFNFKKILLFLLKSGADPDIACLDGWRPLHIMAMRGNIFETAALLKYGADYNQQESLIKETPLFVAIKCNEFRVAALLLSQGADPNIKDTIGRTVFDLTGCKSIIDLEKYISARAGFLASG